MAAPAADRQLRQYNLNAQPGPTTPQSSKDSLKKADKAIKVVEKVPGGAGPIQKGMFDGWWSWMVDTASKSDQALGGEPPRQDYTVISLPAPTTWPLGQPNGSIPPERAAALNAGNAPLVNGVGNGQA